MISASGFTEALEGSFSLADGNHGFKLVSVIVYNIIVYLTFSLSAAQIYMVKKWCWCSQIDVFISIFQVDSMFTVLLASLISSTCTDRNIPLARLTNKHSQFKTFSQPCSNRTFSNCLSHESPARGWSYRFLSRGTTGSVIVDHDFGHLCFGWRVQKSGHSDFGIVKHDVALSTHGCCISCLSWISWKPGCNVHDFCGRHLRCWRSLVSEHCIWTRIIFYNVTSEYDPAFVLLMNP